MKMNQIKPLFSAGLVMLLCGQYVAAVETDQEISAITAQETELKSRDPYFAQWLNGQVVILANLKKNIRQDMATNTPASIVMAQSQKDDFKFMVDKIKTEIRLVRSAPDFAAGRRLNVRDFGALGDGRNDDGPAIRKAIAQAATSPGNVVFLPRGKYLIAQGMTAFRKDNPFSGFPGGSAVPSASRPYSGHLVLVGLKDLQIEGENGTEIICADPLGIAVYLIDCNNVRLRNLTIGYSSRPYFHGTVSRLIDEKTIEITLDPSSTMPSESLFKRAQTGGLLRFYSSQTKPDSLRPAASSIAPHSARPEITGTGDKIFRLTLKNTPSALSAYRVGMRIVGYARTYGNHAINNYCSDRTRMENIRINTSSAMAFLNNASDLAFIINCTVEALPDSYVSTCADGIYFRDGKFGGLVTGNTVRHVGDDFLNIHSYMRPAYRQEGKVVYLPTSFLQPKNLRLGGRIGVIFAGKGEMNVAKETVITAIEIVKGNGNLAGVSLDYQYKITCADTLPLLVTMKDLGDKPNRRAPDMLVLLDAQNHGNVIENNRFEDGVSRFLAGGRNWLFRHNKIIDSLDHYQLVRIGPEPTAGMQGGEGFQPRNIMFAGNEFSSISKTVFNFSSRINRYLPEQPSIATSHVLIEGNHITLQSRTLATPVFRVEQAEDVTIKDNRIDAAIPINAPFAGLKDCRRIVIEGNTMPAAFKALDSKTGTVEEVTLKNNNIESK